MVFIPEKFSYIETVLLATEHNIEHDNIGIFGLDKLLGFDTINGNANNMIPQRIKFHLNVFGND